MSDFTIGIVTGNQYTIVASQPAPQQVVMSAKANQIIQVAPQGTPGVQGPQGDQGPSGAAASTKYGIAVATGTIPDDQDITVCNPTAPNNLTLPELADVISGAVTKKITIRNYSGFAITLLASAGDLVENDSQLVLGGPVASWDLVATSLGWLIV